MTWLADMSECVVMGRTSSFKCGRSMHLRLRVHGVSHLCASSRLFSTSTPSHRTPPILFVMGGPGAGQYNCVFAQRNNLRVFQRHRMHG